MAAILDFQSEQFQLFWSTSSPDAFSLDPSQFFFILVQEKKRKVDFQDGSHGSQLGFLIRTILAIFDLQVTPDASYQLSSKLAFKLRRRS